MAEWLKALDCNSSLIEFGGSNPSRLTKVVVTKKAFHREIGLHICPQNRRLRASGFKSSLRSLQILYFISGYIADGYTTVFWRHRSAGSNPATQTTRCSSEKEYRLLEPEVVGLSPTI